jgi:pyridoxal 5'-phosphate synthase pdxT subunit
VKIGVLALQGAFKEHLITLEKLGAETVEVRRPSELAALDGLIIPGGESTTMVKLADNYGLRTAIQHMAGEGKPIMGTCAGLILLAEKVSDDGIKTLGLMDMTVRRNAFGRQVDSFETSLDIPCLGQDAYQAIFIRAPLIEHAGKKCRVLAELPDGTAVAVRQNNLLALAFHPELSPDTRLHHYFLNMVRESQLKRDNRG